MFEGTQKNVLFRKRFLLDYTCFGSHMKVLLLFLQKLQKIRKARNVTSLLAKTFTLQDVYDTHLLCVTNIIVTKEERAKT